MDGRVSAPLAPGLLVGIDQLIDVLERQITALEERIDQLIDRDGGLGAGLKTLRQVEGVGPTTAVSPLAELPELGRLNHRQIAPRWPASRPSTTTAPAGRGQRHIRGGRSAVRRAPYMAVLTATRCNPVLRPLYQQLLSRGKNTASPSPLSCASYSSTSPKSLTNRKIPMFLNTANSW